MFASSICAEMTQAFAEEDIVAQDHCHAVIADEVPADDEGFGQTVWLWLGCIGEVEAEGAAVFQQALEQRQVMGSGDDEYVPDPCQHQHAQRIVDHRFIIDRQELFRHSECEGIKAGPAAAGKYDALHSRLPLPINALRRVSLSR